MSSTISRVLYSMTIYLDHTLPYDSLRLLPNEDATYLKARRAAVSPSSALRQNIWSCFRWGLHSPFCYQKGGSLLHCHSTLTIIRWRFLFCCTILRVALPCKARTFLSALCDAVICAAPYGSFYHEKKQL